MTCTNYLKKTVNYYTSRGQNSGLPLKMDILSVCPLLVPINSDGTAFTGLISACDASRDFHIEVRLTEPENLKDAQIDCEWQMKELLRGQENVVQKRLNECTSLAVFLAELKAILENQMKKAKSKEDLVSVPKFYSDLMKDMESLGWNRLSYVDSSFKEVHLVASDFKNRNHTLKIQFHQQHPDHPPEYKAELPVHFDYVWRNNTNLSDVFADFEELVQQHQNFWDVLDDIDSNTCVLEPECPSRSATRRRIAIGKGVSVQVELDPRQPFSLPDCRFLGSEQVIGPLKEKLYQNISKWSLEKSFLKNLQTILEVEFPSKSIAQAEDLSCDCGICYSYRLEEEIPDQGCDDPRCAQVFHRMCLCEWLRSIPSSRQSFNMLFGDCPNCGKPITVKISSH